MTAAADAAGRILMVGFNQRYLPHLQRIKQAVADGAIGDKVRLVAEPGQI
jgi:predicted dehydrogenase